MVKFETKKEIVKIEDEEYSVYALSGDHLDTLFEIIKTVNPEGKTELTENEIYNNITPDLIPKIYKVVYATLEDVYPDIDKKQLARFVSGNKNKFLGAIIKLNLG